MSRTQLLQNDIGLIESLRVTGPRTTSPTAESYSPDFQICLPYHGIFVWHVGRDDVVADPNQVLFVAGGEGFRLSQPVTGGYAEMIVTVRPEVFAELLSVPERRLAGHAIFRRRVRPAEPRLQRLGLDYLHRCNESREPGLADDEGLLTFLRAALAVPSTPAEPVSPSTRRLIARAKTFLTANLAAPVRLGAVASAAGTSPAYLTTLFRRVEGRPLHKYLTQLRLARALAELPYTGDLTALSLALGFAHHSHFTAAFRRAFACTPSQFRASSRPERIAIAGRQRVVPIS